MTTRALHVSDLHVGRRQTPELAAALLELVSEIEPEVVIATGDLASRGRVRELELARRMLEGLGPPVVAVPGNHDLPYSVPARFLRPSARFERVFGTTHPTYRSDRLVVCGLDSSWPWRHQGGRLTRAGLAHARAALDDPPPAALRVVALHHHLAGAPWRTSRKLPLRHRDRTLAALADAGAEVVLGGHIHQCVVTSRAEFQVLETDDRSPVLATAPGLGRPRPRRAGEAQGVVVLEWTPSTLAVVPLISDGRRFVQSGRREFARGASSFG